VHESENLWAEGQLLNGKHRARKEASYAADVLHSTASTNKL